VIGVAALLLMPAPTHAQYGIILPGAGPVNRAMGGVAVGTPIDPLGTMFWNPAGIGAFDKSQIGFGVEALIPSAGMTSSLPGTSFNGTVQSASGVIPIPNIALIHRPDEGPFSYGLGIMTLGGFALNYPGSSTDALVTARPPNGVGVGPIYSQYAVLQIVPTVSYRITDQFMVGASPMLNMAQLMVNPGLVTNPDVVAGSPVYPPLVATHYAFGGGFQVGALWRPEENWNVGGSFKSPQWFQSFEYNAANPSGQAQGAKWGLNVPMMASVGGSYTGIDRLVLGLDLHYIGYNNTRGYDSTGFTSTGALRGLGWRDVFAVAIGAQYRITDVFAVQLGYSFNTNPIRNENTFFDAAAPLVTQQSVSVGVSYDVSEKLKVSLAYVHAFQGAATGPIYAGNTPVPGSFVNSTLSDDAILIGATVAY
jgi:long-chain fatty acid transport protein